jgi:Tol biopolymer transport system component
VAAFVVAVALAGAYAVKGRRASAGDAGGSSTQNMKMAVLMSRDDVDQCVLSSDGRYLAYVTAAEEKTSLNVRQVRTGGDVRILPPQEFPVRGISFSPDGDYVYYLNQDPVSPSYSALFQVPSLGGAPRKVFFDVDTAATFSPDGSRLCFRRGKPDVKADTLVVGELATGKDRELLRIAAPVNFASSPAWAPDGKSVAVALQRRRRGPQHFGRSHRRRKRSSGDGRPRPLPFVFMDSLAWLPGGCGDRVRQPRRISGPPDLPYRLPGRGPAD